MQWRAEAALPPGNWAVYMQYLDGTGNLLFQTDHPLGRQITGYIRPLANWPTDKRIYTYVDLPDDWSTQQEKIATIRLGIWDPGTEEYLPITPLQPTLTIGDGLLVPFHKGNFLLGE